MFVRFRRKDDRSTSFLAWTTTPWTLPANMALAVHPDVDYATVECVGERLIVAEPLLQKVFRDEPVHVVATTRGSDLAGVRYEPLFDYYSGEQDRWYVIPADFVTTDDGTGVVHIAPAYGPEDLALGKKCDLPIYYSVDLTGYVVPEVKVAAGLFFKDADKPISADLKARGLMFRAETFRHTPRKLRRVDLVELRVVASRSDPRGQRELVQELAELLRGALDHRLGRGGGNYAIRVQQRLRDHDAVRDDTPPRRPDRWCGTVRDQPDRTDDHHWVPRALCRHGPAGTPTDTAPTERRRGIPGPVRTRGSAAAPCVAATQLRQWPLKCTRRPTNGSVGWRGRRPLNRRSWAAGRSAPC